MGFEELKGWDGDPIVLPINGKSYTIAPVTAELGLRCQSLVSIGVELKFGGAPNADQLEVLTDAGERDLYRDLLGPVHEELLADGVKWEQLKLAAMTVMIDAVSGRESAEQYWAARGKPPAPTNRAERRAKPRSSGSAKRTAKGSTAGTTAPRPRKAKTES